MIIIDMEKALTVTLGQREPLANCMYSARLGKQTTCVVLSALELATLSHHRIYHSVQLWDQMI